MMIVQDLISVIIPVYNVQEYLVKCLDSLRSQTYKKFEVILVDDGSKDRSPVICDSFAVIDSCFKVIHKQNGGASAARNAGLDIATGEYIYFVDSDDYIEPQTLEHLILTMKETQTDWCGLWALKEDEAGNPICQISFGDNRENIDTEEKKMNFLLGEFLNYKVGWEVCFHMFRRDIVEQNNIRFVCDKIDFAEDLLFCLRYLLYAKSYVILPEVLYHYVQRTNSLMKQSKRVNVLPTVHSLAREAYQEVIRAGLVDIKNQFAYLYMAIMEWHTRSYITEFGWKWIKEAVFQLPFKEFVSQDLMQLKELYKKGLSLYGRLAGVVSIVVSVTVEQNTFDIVQHINKMLQQSMQRIEVLLICENGVEIEHQDIRVRKLYVDAFDDVIQMGFEQCYGEYIYFSENIKDIPVDFLERVSDAMKYNGCSSGILCDCSQNMFVSVYDHKARINVRKRLLNEEYARNHVIMKKELLDRSGLKCMKNLTFYMDDLVLSGHTMLVSKEE